MHTKIIRGFVSGSQYKAIYDDDGVEGTSYVFYINNQKLVAKGPRPLYLEDKMEVILEVKDDASGEVLSGLAIKENRGWGKNVKLLKQQLGEFEQYTFVEGVVIEKRRSSSSNIVGRSSGARFTYTIVFKDSDFICQGNFGERLKAGMDIAVVRKQDSVEMIYNKTTGKFYGVEKPWHFLMILLLIAFNVGMYYLYLKGSKMNYTMVLLVINGILLFYTLISISAYFKSKKVKAFLLKKLNKINA